jgi:hypothetical protein
MPRHLPGPDAPGTGKDESAGTLIDGFPADGPQPPILPPRDGFLFLARDKFYASFAGDLPADLTAFMADSQVPWHVDALTGQVTDPAWRTKPSWYMATTEDTMIPPAAPRGMLERSRQGRLDGGHRRPPVPIRAHRADLHLPHHDQARRQQPGRHRARGTTFGGLTLRGAAAATYGYLSSVYGLARRLDSGMNCAEPSWPTAGPLRSMNS